MIVDFFVFMITLIIKTIVKIFPAGSLYPPEFLAGLEFFGENIMRLDFGPIDIGALVNAIVFLLIFEAAYYTVRLIVGFLNWLRGAGPIEV